MKRVICYLLTAVLVAGIAAGCQSQPAGSTGETETPAGETGSSETPVAVAGEGDTDKKATLTFAIYENLQNEYFDTLDLEGRFQELYPNVSIELEKMKNDSEYWNAMKIRASANELPDLMVNKTFTLARFSEYLVDLSGLDAAKNNTVADGYAVDGKILGIPEKVSKVYVYYWEDMLEEAGVEIPTTWDAFIAAAEAVQSHFEANDSDFMAIAMGAKDEWPNFPFTEFMPAVQNGDGFNWNNMAKMDDPFAAGTNMNVTYTKVYDLFSRPVFGKDPLGIGYDQAVALFAQKKAGLMVANDAALARIQGELDDTSGLRTFHLPVRDSESDPFRIVGQGDNFLSVTTHAKEPEIAVDLIEFYFSEAWYGDYINSLPSEGASTLIPKEKDPIHLYADNAAEDELVLVMYDGGGDDFTALVNETKFDYKKLGCEMMVDGFDLQSRFDELNASWNAAREKLGME